MGRGCVVCAWNLDIILPIDERKTLGGCVSVRTQGSEIKGPVWSVECTCGMADGAETMEDEGSEEGSDP